MTVRIKKFEINLEKNARHKHRQKRRKKTLRANKVTIYIPQYSFFASCCWLSIAPFSCCVCIMETRKCWFGANFENLYQTDYDLFHNNQIITLIEFVWGRQRGSEVLIIHHVVMLEPSLFTFHYSHTHIMSSLNAFISRIMDSAHLDWILNYLIMNYFFYCYFPLKIRIQPS